MDTPPPRVQWTGLGLFRMTRLQTPGIFNAKQAPTSFDLYGCSRAKCTDVRLSVSSFRLPGPPSANRERPVSTSRDPYIPADFQDSLVPIGLRPV